VGIDQGEGVFVSSNKVGVYVYDRPGSLKATLLPRSPPEPSDPSAAGGENQSKLKMAVTSVM
jgi:hypothetical protein